jgi:hypothetical protein
MEAAASMRLSDEKARRLNALVWRDRARRLAPVIAVVVFAVAVLTFFLVRQVEKADRTLEVQPHQATVIHIKKSGNGRAAAIVEVRLDDGRSVEAFSAMRVDPMTGAHVVVNEARHASGRLTYDIARVAE